MVLDKVEPDFIDLFSLSIKRYATGRKHGLQETEEIHFHCHYGISGASCLKYVRIMNSWIAGRLHT